MKKYVLILTLLSFHFLPKAQIFALAHAARAIHFNLRFYKSLIMVYSTSEPRQSGDDAAMKN